MPRVTGGGGRIEEEEEDNAESRVRDPRGADEPRIRDPGGDTVSPSDVERTRTPDEHSDEEDRGDHEVDSSDENEVHESPEGDGLSGLEDDRRWSDTEDVEETVDELTDAGFERDEFRVWRDDAGEFFVEVDEERASQRMRHELQQEQAEEWGVDPGDVIVEEDDGQFQARLSESERDRRLREREQELEQQAEEQGLLAGEYEIVTDRESGEVRLEVDDEGVIERERQQTETELARELGVSEDEVTVTAEEGLISDEETAEVGDETAVSDRSRVATLFEVEVSESARRELTRDAAAEQWGVEPDDVDVSVRDGEVTVSTEAEVDGRGFEEGDDWDVDQNDTEAGLTARASATAWEGWRSTPLSNPEVYEALFDDEGMWSDHVDAADQRLEGASAVWEERVVGTFTGYREQDEEDLAGIQYQGTMDFAAEAGEFAARFSNPGEIGRDILRIGEGAYVAGEFLDREGAEGFQRAFDGTRAAAPQIASSAADAVRENPRRAAAAGVGLAATAGIGAVTSRTIRGTARGVQTATQRTRTLDMSSPVQRARSQAPDVSVRRSPDSPRLDVDPMLSRQIRDRVSAGSNVGSPFGSPISRDLGVDALSTRGINVAQDAASRARDGVPSMPTRDSIPNIGFEGSGVRGAARDARRRAEGIAAATPTSASDVARAAGRLGDDVRVAMGRGRVEVGLARREAQTRAVGVLPPLPGGPGGPSLPSRPTLGLQSRVDDAAFSAGQGFETRRRRAQLQAAATEARVRERASDIVDATPTSASDIAELGSGVRENLGVTAARLSVDASDVRHQARVRSVGALPALPAGPSSVSIGTPRAVERASDAVDFARDASIHVGPLRPPRQRRVDVGDIEDDLGPFANDLNEFTPDPSVDTSSAGTSGRIQIAPTVSRGETGRTRTQTRTETELDVQVRPMSRRRTARDEIETGQGSWTPLGATAGAGGAVGEVSVFSDGLSPAATGSSIQDSFSPINVDAGAATDTAATASDTVSVIGTPTTGFRSGAGQTFSTPTATTTALETPLQQQPRTASPPRHPRRGGRPRGGWFSTSPDTPTDGPSPGDVESGDFLNPVATPMQVLGGFGTGGGNIDVSGGDPGAAGTDVDLSGGLGGGSPGAGTGGWGP